MTDITLSDTFTLKYVGAKVEHECTHCGFEATMHESEYECPMCKIGKMCRVAHDVVRLTYSGDWENDCV